MQGLVLHNADSLKLRVSVFFACQRDKYLITKAFSTETSSGSLFFPRNKRWVPAWRQFKERKQCQGWCREKRTSNSRCVADNFYLRDVNMLARSRRETSFSTLTLLRKKFMLNLLHDDPAKSKNYILKLQLQYNTYNTKVLICEFVQELLSARSKMSKQDI